MEQVKTVALRRLTATLIVATTFDDNIPMQILVVALSAHNSGL